MMGASAVEIGAGTAVCGLTAAVAGGARVVVTDSSEQVCVSCVLIIAWFFHGFYASAADT